MTFIKKELGELPENWQPAPEEYRRYIAKAILYRDIQRIVKEDESITAYRINVTTYIASLLAEKTARRIDLDAIWKRQAISPALAATARAWCPVVFKELLTYAQSQTVHIDNVLKSQAASEHMLSLHLRIPREVERELRPSAPPEPAVFKDGPAPQRPDNLSTSDHNNIARCMEVDAEQWLVAVNWAKKSGQFMEITIKVAGTLAGYAAQAWPKPPSPKQAKHGAEIIEAARSAGIL
jgi:hypothetical protein